MGPEYGDIMEMTASGWSIKPNDGQTWITNKPVAPNTTPRTAKEFLELEPDKLSEDELRKELNLALIAFEEAQESWERERTERASAERDRDNALELVKKLREIGFNGDGEKLPESEPEQKKEHSGGIVSGGNITYTSGNIKVSRVDQQLLDHITKKNLRGTSYGS